MLKEQTTTQARILWEDRRGARQASRWTALLPVLTGRAFVGGLDPDGAIDHTAGGLIDQTLGGRPLDDWTDAELRDYFDHYNIGWVACWSENSARRLPAATSSGRTRPMRAMPTAELVRRRRRPAVYVAA